MGIASQSIYFYLIFRKKLFLVMTAKAGINFRRHSVLDTESSDFKKKVGGSPTPNHWPSASLRYSSSREAAELALTSLTNQSLFGAQTVLAENSRLDCVVPVLGMPTKCPLLHSDLGVIGMAAGDLGCTEEVIFS